MDDPALGGFSSCQQHVMILLTGSAYIEDIDRERSYVGSRQVLHQEFIIDGIAHDKHYEPLSFQV
jgi:hypothetical protein